MWVFGWWEKKAHLQDLIMNQLHIYRWNQQSTKVSAKTGSLGQFHKAELLHKAIWIFALFLLLFKSKTNGCLMELCGHKMRHISDNHNIDIKNVIAKLDNRKASLHLFEDILWNLQWQINYTDGKTESNTCKLRQFD